MELSDLPSGRLPWPLFTIDFEASGLGEFTYPIEIGITRWETCEAAFETWSTLIRPPKAWREHRIWNQAAERIHGLSRDQLDDGASPHEALLRANEIIGTQLAFCDGGEHDLRWLLHLAQAAGVGPSFQLADWGALGSLLTPEQFLSMNQRLGAEPASHRAGADAERLMKGLSVGLGVARSNA